MVSTSKSNLRHVVLAFWYVTGGKQVPRQAQLESCFATFGGKDSLVYTGTGSGLETLPIALNILLEDQLITITICLAQNRKRVWSWWFGDKQITLCMAREREVERDAVRRESTRTTIPN